MNYEFKIKNIIKLMPINTYRFTKLKTYTFGLIVSLASLTSFAQIETSIDTTAIKIGEQITYKVEVKSDSTSTIIFPEGQSFLPLEMVTSYKVDTIKDDVKHYKFIKKYALTQFDSGAYYIPQQKININGKSFLTDSLRVEVNTIKVDTIKQGLYDIKPIIAVNKVQSKWWIYALIILIALILIAFLLYWLFWKEKKLTEEEKIALLPPYERAKLALQKLDNTPYLEHQEVKEYYSELTFIIRSYLDEKVYDRALESTSAELISRLRLLREGNQIDLDKETINNLESILQRADLVKFAKSKPDVELAKMDRNTIDVEIDQVKESLPEPTEEEKLLDLKYQQELERKQKQKKIYLSIATGLGLLIATYIGFGLKYDFKTVNDTLTRQPYKILLEDEWVTSAYGFPPIYISTPKVLKRVDTSKQIPEEAKDKINVTAFAYGTFNDAFSVSLNTTFIKTPPQGGAKQNDDTEEESPFDPVLITEQVLKSFEAKGVSNITVKQDKFSTPRGAEGLKTHGTFSISIKGSNTRIEANYSLFIFTNKQTLKQIIITTPQNDSYADKIKARIIDSIELIAEKEEDTK